jgi:hypothetical protein
MRDSLLTKEENLQTCHDLDDTKSQNNNFLASPEIFIPDPKKLALVL